MKMQTEIPEESLRRNPQLPKTPKYTFSKDDIQRRRDRWQIHAGLELEIATILTQHRDPSSAAEVSELMWAIHAILPSDGFDKVNEGCNVFDFPSMYLQNIPILDLGGMKLHKVDISKCILPLARLDSVEFTEVNMSYSYFVGSCFDYAQLNGCIFAESTLRFTSFRRSKTLSCDFRAADLHGDFYGARLVGANLKGADLGGSDLRKSWFFACECGEHSSHAIRNMSENNNSTSLIPYSRSSNTSFSNNKYLDSYTYCFKNKEYRNLLKLYRSRWFYTRFEGLPIEFCDASGAQNLKRYVEDQRAVQNLREQSKFGYIFWNLTTACGWSTMRLMFWAIMVIIFFAGLYANLNLVTPPDIVSQVVVAPSIPTIGVDSILKPIATAKPPSVSPAFQWFYVSFDIFTNLGIRVTTKPASNWGVVVMFIETILGWMTLGLAITVFANKYARRS